MLCNYRYILLCAFTMPNKDDLQSIFFEWEKAPGIRLWAVPLLPLLKTIALKASVNQNWTMELSSSSSVRVFLFLFHYTHQFLMTSPGQFLFLGYSSKTKLTTIKFPKRLSTFSYLWYAECETKIMVFFATTKKKCKIIFVPYNAVYI